MNSILKSNSNVYKVLVDCGNSSTKAQCILPSGEVVRIIIPTLASKGSDKVGMGGYVIEDFEGESYVVGDENKTINTNIMLSKMDMTHKLSTLTAIHQLVDNGAEVELSVGLPIHSYYNVEYRKEYIEFYSQHEDLTLTINGIEKSFSLVKVSAKPEGVGHVFNFPTEGLIGVIDIGYTTIDGAVFKDCSPLAETVFSLIDGANPFKTTVRDNLNKELLLNIQPYQLDEILSKGLYGAKSQQADEIINKCKKEYLKKIVNEMLKHGWEIQTLPIVFTGGGSLLLKDMIEQIDTFIVSDNCIFDNLDGFTEMEMILNG